MTAFRLVRFLEGGGFLDQRPSGLRLARLDELLERWQASAALRMPPGFHARWLLPGSARERMSRLQDAFGDDSCLGLFVAADAHGLGVVRGVPADVYVRIFSPENAKRAGLIGVEPGDSADVIFRVPASRASVFRCAVVTSAGRAADVLQVWLDVAHHASRGKEQAEHIRRRVIDPMLKHARNS